VAGGLIGQFTALTFQGLGTAITAVFQGDGAKAAEQVSGPVGIVVLLKEGSLIGVQFVLLIIAIISLTLAIMNVLPIPALDGGRLYMVLLARLFGKELSQEMEERIVGASFIFLLFLIVLITVVDVRRFF
jgi:regulator of sigma E protease